MTLTETIARIFPAEQQIPETYRLPEPIDQMHYLVNGKLHPWEGSRQEVFSPVFVSRSSGISRQYLGRYPLLTEKEALEALEAASQAYDHGQGAWPRMSVQDRIKHVEQFAFQIKAMKSEVVKLLMWEIGKSYEDSEKEFDRTLIYIKNTIDAFKDLDRSSSRFVIEQGIIGQIRRTPLGVALCLGPFNYPLNETMTAVIPALIMGNTVLFKPPKLGVLLYSPILAAFRDCFPPGVVNTVYGRGAQVLGALMASGKIDVLGFIGTSRVAAILKKQHPQPHRLRSSLGLEAKNPAVILPDADLDLTVSECLLGGLSFNGQRCTALKMLFVHSDILPDFLSKFSQALQQIQFGMPWQPGVLITPLAEDDKPAYLTGLIEDACRLGARVVNDGGGVTNRSIFYPALLCPVSDRMRIFHEEQFGPIIPVVPFDDLGTPIQYLIHSSYGQQISIFSTNPEAIARLVDTAVTQVGRVNINSQCQRGPDTFPFTGRKDSAEGTLSVHDALRVFSLRTLVAAKETAINKSIITDILQEHRSNFLSTDFIL
jgi:glyceraldehyde-3-phosphate dehydrogenase (NADP+)